MNIGDCTDMRKKEEIAKEFIDMVSCDSTPPLSYKGIQIKTVVNRYREINCNEFKNNLIEDFYEEYISGEINYPISDNAYYYLYISEKNKVFVKRDLTLKKV